MSELNSTIAKVTERVIEKSRDSRQSYLDLMDREADRMPDMNAVSCSNLAHAFAGAVEDQETLRQGTSPNIGIVTAYNDMLSAHQPYGRYPDRMKVYAREVGATAQVAGGTPAMCDGVTQGEDGMELSLFSRDVIALSTGVALSHQMYSGMALLGICDKIVPGLMIGALRFGHLPAVFVPPTGAGQTPLTLMLGVAARHRPDRFHRNVGLIRQCQVLGRGNIGFAQVQRIAHGLRSHQGDGRTYRRVLGAQRGPRQRYDMAGRCDGGQTVMRTGQDRAVFRPAQSKGHRGGILDFDDGFARDKGAEARRCLVFFGVVGIDLFNEQVLIIQVG